MPNTSSSSRSRTPLFREMAGRTAQARAVVLLAVLAIFFTLHLARTFVLPVVLTILLAFVLRPVVTALGRWHIPAGVTAAFLIVLLLGGGGFLLTKFYEPAVEWVRHAPVALAKIERRLQEFRRPMAEAGKAAEEVQKLTDPDRATRPPVEVSVREPGIGSPWISGTVSVVGNIVVMAFLLFFLLATGGALLTKIAQFGSPAPGADSSVELVGEVERQVSRYLATITIINLLLGAAVGSALWVIGLPNPFFWGGMVTLLNFIPYLGGVVGSVMVGLAAFIAFDDLGHALAAPAAYITINTIEGMVVTPTILGRRFALDPCFVFIWLVFWSWIWGVSGAVLAVPMLTVLKIVSERVPALQSFARMIAAAEKTDGPLARLRRKRRLQPVPAA